jgi:hypothetical protein
VLKPGGISMSTEDIILTGSRAVDRSILLHSHLLSALQSLDTSYHQTRVERLEHLRKYRIAQEIYHQQTPSGRNSSSFDPTQDQQDGFGGIDIDDPILKYNFNHAAVASAPVKTK